MFGGGGGGGGGGGADGLASSLGGFARLILFPLTVFHLHVLAPWSFVYIPLTLITYNRPYLPCIFSLVDYW